MNLKKNKRKQKARARLFVLFIVFASFFVALALAWHYWPYQAGRALTASVFQQPVSRPNGMAPAAFDGFLRACNNARIHPLRIGQTIGDHPFSVGYHHRDGVVRWRGKRLDYCAAVDLGTADLTRGQINRFLETLAAQGFAAFYRERGKWRGHEHIHAIYAPLIMKWQLQGQVREWESARRRNGKKRYRWQKRWRRNWR